jgi:hypothetical protein
MANAQARPRGNAAAAAAKARGAAIHRRAEHRPWLRLRHCCLLPLLRLQCSLLGVHWLAIRCIVLLLLGKLCRERLRVLLPWLLLLLSVLWGRRLRVLLPRLLLHLQRQPSCSTCTL